MGGKDGVEMGEGLKKDVGSVESSEEVGEVNDVQVGGQAGKFGVSWRLC